MSLELIQQKVEDLYKKIQTISKRYKQLQTEHENLKEAFHAAQSTIEVNRTQILLLEQNLQVAKLSVGTLTPAEKRALQKKIEQYLKDIEICLAFINT